MHICRAKSGGRHADRPRDPMEQTMTRRITRTLCVLAMALTVGACESNEDSGTTAKDEAVAAAQAEANAAADEAKAAAAKRAAIEPECRVDVAVTGMVCNAGCTPTVMSALEEVEGVASVNVDFETKHAAVDGAGTVCTETGSGALIDALKGVEFDGSVEKIENI